MKVFISHTTSDDVVARKVYNRLTKVHEIDCYIDDIDIELAKNRGKSSITPLLVKRLRECDTLLAVVTENTKNSWWVPFEIGTAREIPMIISSFTNLSEPSIYSFQNVLPEYLLEWPRLRTDEDIDAFAVAYKKRNLISESFGLESNTSSNNPLQNTRDFESSVMKSLGQRRY